jgi:hypothetical protein
MVSIISFLETVYDSLLISPFSVIIGCLLGWTIGLKVRLPKSGMGLFGIFLLVCFSPKIGKHVYLVKTPDVNILASSLIFSVTLTMFLVILYRFYKLDKEPYSKENE